MARDALGKLQEASVLDKEAAKLKAKDPVSASELQNLARLKRKSAIKQMRRRPKRRKSADRTVL